MNNSIDYFIDICSWDSVSFFILSDNVFGPIIYYSHLFPLFASLILVSFVFFHNKSLSVKWLFTTTILLSFYLFFDLILWATDRPDFTVFFWSLLILIEPMIYAGMLFFIYAFLENKAMPFNKKFFVFLLLLPTVLLTPTRLAIVEFDLSNCYREAIEGPLVFYGYIIEIIFLAWILLYGLKKFLNTDIKKEKKIIFISILGVGFFLLSFSMGNVLGTLLTDWIIGQYGLFGIPIFLGFLAYLIVRYKAFNIEIISAQVLIMAIWVLVPSILFLRKIENVRVIVIITSVLIFIMGIYLYNSVKKEVKQKKELEDISAKLKIAYEKEKYLNDELKRLDEAKNQFMLATQHHLRTPLTSMQGYLELLLDGMYGKIPPNIKEVIEKIQKSTKNEIRVVEELLSISQFQMGKNIVNPIPGINIENIIEEIVNYLKLEAEKKGIDLKFKKNGNLPKIKADKSKLKVAIVNIIDNAVKYTEKGGVTITLKIEKEKLNISIKDTGIGIKKGEAENLFSKTFERGEEAQKLFTTGRGIGLYITGKIIEGHGGKIWAQSKGLKKGSTFIIELPLQKE